MSILSIQSHVSYGHVGNSAGVFILQRMGFEVWPVHTVLFSNHPNYGGFKGCEIEPEQISDIISGLGDRSLFDSCEAVIGGYLGTAGTGEVLLSTVKQVKQCNPNCLFFCDPVMGDHEDGIYVAESIVEFFKEKGAPAADVLKPNSFELQVLADQTVSDPQSAANAAGKLLDQWNLQAVVVSSVPVPNSCDVEKGELIGSMAVTKNGTWLVETPLLPIEQKGAGDAFMALLVANILSNGKDLPQALSSSASAIWSIMNDTIGLNVRELPLIAEQDKFSHPPHKFKETILSQDLRE